MNLHILLVLLFIPPVLALASPQTAETHDEPAQDTTIIPAPRPSPDSLGFSRGIDQSFFTHFPGRGIEAALAAGPGIAVSRTGLLLMRGEYESAITLTIEGAVVNDRITGGIALPITAEAIEHVDVSADGPVSRPGGAGSGLVELRYRTGGRERWGGSLLVETDRYTGMDNRSLGGYSYGYSDWTGTIGGPVPGTGNALSVFVALQNTFYRDPTVSLRSGYSFTGANAIVTEPVVTPAHASARPDTLNIAFPEGNAPGGQYNNWNLTGSSLLDLGTMQIRIAGSYGTSRAQEAADLINVFNQSRLPIEIAGSGFLRAGLRHTVSRSIRYDVGVSFRRSTSVSEDPRLLDNLFSYGDPSANAALGYTMSVVGNQSIRWPAYSLWEMFSVNQPGTQVAMFQKRAESAYGTHGSVTIDVGAHELSAGGEYSGSSLRTFGPVDAFPWWSMRNSIPDPATLERLLVGGQLFAGYGYNVFGGEINDNALRNGGMLYLGPRRPVSWGGYVQDAFPLLGMAVSAGLRYDRIDGDVTEVADPANLQFTPEGLPYASQFVRTGVNTQFSPRISVAIPSADMVIIHADFGRYLQQALIDADWRDPARVTQYELGCSGRFKEIGEFDITGFYREVTNPVGLVYSPGYTSAFIGYGREGDQSSVGGFEFVCNIFRTSGFSARLNYTFSDYALPSLEPLAYSIGTGGIIATPRFSYVYEQDAAHRGHVLMDYMFGDGGAGSILDGLDLNVLASFQSGNSVRTPAVAGLSYGDPRFRTPGEPGTTLRGPWIFQLDGRVDRTIPIGTFSLDLYVYAINLLGRENAVSVFPRTGDPGNDGWLQTDAGRMAAAGNGPQFVAFYDAVVNGKNSGNWGPPRQIRFGARLDL